MKHVIARWDLFRAFLSLLLSIHIPKVTPTVPTALPSLSPSSSSRYYFSTIAGTGVAGRVGDNGTATLAQVNQPYGVWGDSSGNIYFCDYANALVRKISSSGRITEQELRVIPVLKVLPHQSIWKLRTIFMLI